MTVFSTRICLVFLLLYSGSASDDPEANSPTKQSRIYGGHLCVEDEKDGIVHLGNDTVYNCGGSMINNLWGLTAAHCVYKNNNYRYAVELVTSERYLIKTIYVHPEYNTRPIENDIAMLYLVSPIPSGKINYVQLPSKDEIVCSSPLLKGWGKTESATHSKELMCVNLPYLESSVCQEKKILSEKYMKNVICTLAPGKDACNGDSGGPLTCGKVQVGIVSYGPANCGDPDSPGVYTKVSSYLDFIDETMKKQRKSGVVANGSHFKIVLVGLLILLIFKYCL